MDRLAKNFPAADTMRSPKLDLNQPVCFSNFEDQNQAATTGTAKGFDISWAPSSVSFSKHACSSKNRQLWISICEI